MNYKTDTTNGFSFGRHPFVAGAAKLLPGLLLTLLIALASAALAAIPQVAAWGFSALTIAIVAGILLGNTVFARIAGPCLPGVGLAKARFLRLGIVLYGFRLSLQDIGAVGASALAADAVMLSSTFLLAYWLGRRKLGMDEQSTLLIGAGSAICGAAAVLATEPVARASADKVAVAVATVVVFGTIGMFLYPLIYSLAAPLGLSEFAYGVYTGSTVHEVAQVLAAGSAVGEHAANTAVISKMLRVMMLAPFLLLLSAWLARRGSRAGAASDSGARIVIPWFALWFIALVGFNSLHLLPAALVDQLLVLDNLLLAMAMAALGLTTHASAIRQAGAKPLLLAALLFLWLVLGGAAVNYAAAMIF